MKRFKHYDLNEARKFVLSSNRVMTGEKARVIAHAQKCECCRVTLEVVYAEELFASLERREFAISE